MIRIRIRNNTTLQRTAARGGERTPPQRCHRGKAGRSRHDHGVRRPQTSDNTTSLFVFHAPTSIASLASVLVATAVASRRLLRTSSRKPAGTPASGDAANGRSPARSASSSSRSIAARVRATTGCTHTAALSILASGFEESNAAMSARSSDDVSVGRSAGERSSCRSRCQGSPLNKRETKSGQRSSDHRVIVIEGCGTYSPGTTMFDAVSRMVIPKLP
jgi:hypothetical protein